VATFDPWYCPAVQAIQILDVEAAILPLPHLLQAYEVACGFSCDCPAPHVEQTLFALALTVPAPHVFCKKKKK
jgi:hypothetical protein